MNWLREHQSPLKIETPYQRFPLHVQLMPLSRDYYNSLKSKPEESYKHEKSNPKKCLEPEKIKMIQKAKIAQNFASLLYTKPFSVTQQSSKFVKILMIIFVL